METYDPAIASFSLLRAWISICRECGCSEEQVREIDKNARMPERSGTFFQEFTPSQELELEDVAMWLGEGPARPLN